MGTILPSVILGVALASGASVPCPCDCDADGMTRASELVRGVNVALGRSDADTCPAIPGCAPGEPCAVAIGALVDCVDSALQGCSREATPTPTATPPPASDDASASALALLDDIAAAVCSGVLGTPGGSFSTSTTENGATLSCDSFTGHRGTVALTGFASSAEARAAFGEPGPDEEVVEIGGGTARILLRKPSCCPDGSLVDWAWARDCWLIEGSSFDDTSFELAPRPRQVVDEILQSELLEEFLSFCRD